MSDLKNSVTMDSNPEGINQYSMAAAAAKVASSNAVKLGKIATEQRSNKGLHDAAAKAHTKASELHEAARKLAPTQEKKEFHARERGEHANNSGYHTYTGKAVAGEKHENAARRERTKGQPRGGPGSRYQEF